MFLDQNLHTSLWAEASNTAVYIQNRCPHSELNNKTPKEAFTRNKPNVSHLRIFGCPVYFHIPKEKRTKLEPSGKKGIFVGYSKSAKAYRIYVLGQRHIELSRDVIFEEDLAFLTSKDIACDDSFQSNPLENHKEYHDVIEYDPIPLSEPSTSIYKKISLWATKMLEDANNYEAPA